MIFRIYVVYKKSLFFRDILQFFSSIEPKLEIYGWLPKYIRNNIKHIGRKLQLNALELFSISWQFNLNKDNLDIVLLNIGNDDILPNIMFGLSKGEISILHCRGWDDIYINPSSFISSSKIKQLLHELMNNHIIKDFEEFED